MTVQSMRSLESTVRPTTIIESVRLNSQTGLNITFASETFQITGSFKFRAAFNVAANVPQQRLIAASSGNFGQALAYACKLLGKKCTIVMPDNSAQVKISAVREFGATVDLVETLKKTRKQRIAELSESDPEALVVSAYDDPLVISGNASIGRELGALKPSFDDVIVPIGGGGLAAGVIEGLQSVGCGSTVRVYAAEPLIANDAAQSLRSGNIVRFDAEPQTIADGVRTPSLGQHNWAILRTGLAGVIEVEEQTIIRALRMLFLLANLKAEPTGALSLAAALTRPDLFAGRRVCCVVSGGNVDPDVFTRLIQTS